MPKLVSPSLLSSQLLILLLASDSAAFPLFHSTSSNFPTPAFRTTTTATTTSKSVLLKSNQQQQQQQQQRHQRKRVPLFVKMAIEKEEGDNGEFVSVSNCHDGNNEKAKATTDSTFNAIFLEKEEEDDAEVIMPSLDDVLNRARKKKLVIPMAMVQSFFDAPLFILRIPDVTRTSSSSTTTTILAIFTRMDGLLIFISSVLLHANGFALGLLIGKLTIRPVTKLFNPPPPIQSLLLPSWAVFWAIGLDQVL